MSPKTMTDPLLPKSEKLTLSTKLAYGAGDLGAGLTATLLGVSLQFFFTNVAGLSPLLAGTVLLIGKISDAINDPIIGVMSDRTQSRWGRRHSWMLMGALPFGFFFYLQWIIPRFSADFHFNQWALFWYYVAIGVLFNIAFTAVNLPYTALTPELTQDYNERTSLNSFRFAFSISGSIIILVAGFFADKMIASPTQRYWLLGLGGGILSVLSTYWCVWGTQERYTTPTTSESIPILKQIKIALANRPFLYVMGIYLCSWLAFQLTITIIPYFVKYRMERGDSYFDVALIVQMVAFIMLFVWSAISKRIGKRMVYFMGMSLWIIAQAGLFFLQPGQVRLMYLLSVMAGVGVATAYLIPWSMLPDVIELDELTTGKRREGTFYAFMTLLQKMSLALAIFVVGLVLEKTGFQPLNPPESARIAIQVAIGPLPTIILLVGLVLAYFYPITPEVHAEILLKLRERRLGLAEESQQGPPQMDVMDEL